MFRRLESGLPKDPVFPPHLSELGYFINAKDEIRSIEDPKAYFKFFLTKNERHNGAQREAMNEAIRTLIADRLINLGLDRIRLPLGAKEGEPNLPIFISSDLSNKQRVIILFYEHTQDLGVFAHRIIGGKGGINQGSAIDFVKYIQSQESSPSNSDSPGIILANLGQLRWWRRGKKAVTQTSWFALPQKSAVDASYRFDSTKNTIPHNRNTAEHVGYIFNNVVSQMVDAKAKLNIIGVSDGAYQVSVFLENEENFKKWGRRVDAFAAVATIYQASEIKNVEFRNWLIDRGRAYLISEEPSGTFLASHSGDGIMPAYSCPSFSLGEPYYTENMLPKGYKVVLDWLKEVAWDPCYANPEFKRFDSSSQGDGDN